MTLTTTLSPTSMSPPPAEVSLNLGLDPGTRLTLCSPARARKNSLKRVTAAPVSASALWLIPPAVSSHVIGFLDPTLAMTLPIGSVMVVWTCTEMVWKSIAPVAVSMTAPQSLRMSVPHNIGTLSRPTTCACIFTRTPFMVT